MKVLLVGGGARECAIAESLHNSGANIIVAMSNRNPRILSLSVDNLKCSEKEVSKIAKWAYENKVDFAIIGLEDPLGLGIVDELKNYDIPAVGPQKEAANIEMSKLFARKLMTKYNIPGQVEYFVTSNIAELKGYISNSNNELVLKPIGLTAGKGVMVMGDQLFSKKEAIEYGQKVIETGIGGFNQLLIEEKLYGQEFTIQCFVDGINVVPMPAVQDHKRFLEGDKGPNTGGMGSYSQADGLLPFLIKEEYIESVNIIEQVVSALKNEGYEYKGILYGQFMLTDKGIKVIEFNARFGDPECMNVLPLLKTNFVDICWGIIKGKLNKMKIEFNNKATVCKYIVPKNYGTKPIVNAKIFVDEKSINEIGGKIFYAKVNENKGVLITTASRSIGVVGIGNTINEAENIAEKAISFIKGDYFVRHDIGKKEIIDSKVRSVKDQRMVLN